MSSRTFAPLNIILPDIQLAPGVQQGDPVTPECVDEAAADKDLIMAMYKKGVANITEEHVLQAKDRAKALEHERTNLQFPWNLNPAGPQNAVAQAVHLAINPLQHQMQQMQQQMQQMQQQMQQTQQQMQQMQQQTQQQMQQMLNMQQELQVSIAQDSARSFNRHATQGAMLAGKA
jgi:TolA-binding protein